MNDDILRDFVQYIKSLFSWEGVGQLRFLAYKIIVNLGGKGLKRRKRKLWTYWKFYKDD